MVIAEKLSVVMPVYNEADVIDRVIEELEADVVSRFDDAELIVVDDASTDGTGRTLDELAARHPRLRVEHAAQNAGHGPSVLRALELAQGDWIFQLDSDRQFDVRDFWKLWERRQDADLVLGVRAGRHDPRHRLVLTRIVRAVVSLLAGRRVRDANVPFRLLRRAVWEDLRPAVASRPLAPSILVTLGAVARGWRVVEVPVRHLPREHGTSTLRALRLVRFSLRGLLQLFSFRYALARAGPRKPSRG